MCSCFILYYLEYSYCEENNERSYRTVDTLLITEFLYAAYHTITGKLSIQL